MRGIPTMKYQKAMPSKKLSLFAYLILVFYVFVLFMSAWFSSYQSRIAREMQQDFRQQKNRLINEISKLQAEEAALTTMKHVYKIAKELQMVQPSKPIQILQDKQK